MAKKEAEVHGIRIKETRADRTFNVINLIFWMLVLFITLYPLWLVLIASVSDPDAVLAGEVLFWPKGFSLMGYEAVFQHSELWQSYLNSIIYTVLGSALSVIVSLAAAYALSRKFAGKAFVNFLITFTMFFSGGLIPIFLNVRDLGLYDTRLVMILMNTVSVWNLMVARTYIQSSIPNELYEAAVMDGADHFTYFFRCVLPLSGTIIAVLSVYYGVARWNDYFTGLVFIRNRAYLPLQTVLREILASLSISGSSDTFFAAYADNLGGLQEAMRNLRDILPQARKITDGINQALVLNNRALLSGKLDELLAFLKHSSMTPFAFRLIYNDVIHTLLREHAANVADSSDMKDMYDIFSLSGCQSVDDLDELLRRLCDAILQAEKPAPTEESGGIEEVAAYIREHYADPELSISAIAEAFGVSTARLSLSFKERNRVSPNEYLAILRVERSKQLLTETELSIKEIAVNVGYYDASSFIRRFKQITGVTPLQYRRSKEDTNHGNDA